MSAKLTRPGGLLAILAVTDDLLRVFALDFNLGLATETDTSERHYERWIVGW